MAIRAQDECIRRPGNLCVAVRSGYYWLCMYCGSVVKDYTGGNA